MFFDAKAELEDIRRNNRNQPPTPAIPAISAIRDEIPASNSWNSGNSDTPRPEQTVYDVIKLGAKTNGAVMADSGLGGTVCYQLVE